MEKVRRFVIRQVRSWEFQTCRSLSIIVHKVTVGERQRQYDSGPENEYVLDPYM